MVQILRNTKFTKWCKYELFCLLTSISCNNVNNSPLSFLISWHNVFNSPLSFSISCQNVYNSPLSFSISCNNVYNSPLSFSISRTSRIYRPQVFGRGIHIWNRVRTVLTNHHAPLSGKYSALQELHSKSSRIRIPPKSERVLYKFKHAATIGETISSWQQKTAIFQVTHALWRYMYLHWIERIKKTWCPHISSECGIWALILSDGFIGGW